MLLPAFLIAFARARFAGADVIRAWIPSGSPRSDRKPFVLRCGGDRRTRVRAARASLLRQKTVVAASAYLAAEATALGAAKFT